VDRDHKSFRHRKPELTEGKAAKKADIREEKERLDRGNRGGKGRANGRKPAGQELTIKTTTKKGKKRRKP